MITLRQLRYFESVARHLHFGRAADECGISQPALSQQIREMEAVLGVRLIERGSRRIALTAKGEEIARRGLRILGDMRDLVDFARHDGAVLSGPLKLGVIPSVAPYLLPRALPQVHAAYPALDLRLRETRTQQLVEELLEGRLDLVLMALGFDPEDLPAAMSAPDLGVTGWNTLKIDWKSMMTSLDGVFAAGDIVRGASLVVWAVRDGRDAAERIHSYLTTKALAAARIAAE